MPKGICRLVFRGKFSSVWVSRLFSGIINGRRKPSRHRHIKRYLPPCRTQCPKMRKKDWKCQILDKLIGIVLFLKKSKVILRGCTQSKSCVLSCIIRPCARQFSFSHSRFYRITGKPVCAPSISAALSLSTPFGGRLSNVFRRRAEVTAKFAWRPQKASVSKKAEPRRFFGRFRPVCSLLFMLRYSAD